MYIKSINEMNEKVNRYTTKTEKQRKILTTNKNSNNNNEEFTKSSSVFCSFMKFVADNARSKLNK